MPLQFQRFPVVYHTRYFQCSSIDTLSYCLYRPDFHSSNTMPCPSTNGSELAGNKLSVQLYITNLTKVLLDWQSSECVSVEWKFCPIQSYQCAFALINKVGFLKYRQACFCTQSPDLNESALVSKMTMKGFKPKVVNGSFFLNHIHAHVYIIMSVFLLSSLNYTEKQVTPTQPKQHPDEVLFTSQLRHRCSLSTQTPSAFTWELGWCWGV